MIRVLIVGYVFAIRSERRLCSEVQVNLVSSALRTGFPIIQCFAVPGTSAFAKAMHCAVYLRAWWRSASRLDWLAAKDFRSMPA